QGSYLAPRGDVPEFACSVGAPCREGLAVGRERDREQVAGVSSEGGELLTGSDVPELHHVIVTPGSQERPVRRERRAGHLIPVPLEGGDLPPGGDIPELQLLVSRLVPRGVAAPGGQERALG